MVAWPLAPLASNQNSARGLGTWTCEGSFKPLEATRVLRQGLKDGIGDILE